MNLEVRNMVGIARIQSLSFIGGGTDSEGGSGFLSKAKSAPPPPPPVSPEKITITATVQCVFQIEK